MADSRLLQLTTPGLIDLYVLDLSPLGLNEQVRFCNFAAAGGVPLSFDGQEYTPIPILGAEFGLNISNADEQPRLEIADVAKVVSAILADFDDELGGAVIYRTRVFTDNLDTGFDPDPSAAFPTQRYIVENHSTNSIQYTFYLGTVFDVARLQVPRRRLRSVLDDNFA